MAVNQPSRDKATGRELHELFREVFRLQAALAAVKDQVHEQAGLGSPHKRVAEVLFTKGAATVPEVAAELGVSRQFVQTVCHGLERQGLLTFNPNPRHKRSRLASLTTQGKTTITKVMRKEEAIIKSGMPEMDRQAVLQASGLLRCLAERLQQMPGRET